MVILADEPELLTFVWLAVLVLSSIASAFFIFRMVASRALTAVEVPMAIVGAVGLTLYGAAELASIETAIRPPLRVIVNVAVIAMLLGVVAVYLRAVFLPQPAPSRWARAIALTAALLSFAVAARGSDRLNHFAHLAESESRYSPWTRPGTQVTATEAMAVSDSGKPIPLYRWEIDADDFSSYIRALERTFKDVFPAIEVEGPSRDANCHGWVFVGGGFLLSNESVEFLLCENGYREVASPLPGDLIIYRSARGAIVHSGIVRSCLADGTVLIESKWGLSKRYLHRPNDQPYGRDYGYYRSNREGHSLVVAQPSLKPAGSVAAEAPETEVQSESLGDGREKPPAALHSNALRQEKIPALQ